MKLRIITLVVLFMSLSLPNVSAYRDGYPPYEFKVVDALITNFHMPKSTLLAMVSAFLGYEKLMSAYNTALKEDYRFASYGDAMFIS